MSDSEGERGRVFNIPDQNASPRTLHKALIETQKIAGAALKQNQVLRTENAKAEASKPGRKTKTADQPRGLKGPNTLGYHGVIIPLGKSFTVLEFPWIDTSAFSAKVSFPQVSPSDLWKPNPISPMFPQQLTATIYKHVPVRYHPLVNFTGEHGRHFAENFCHHSSAQRSTALKTLKTELPAILLGQKFITDIHDRSAWRALIVLPEDMGKKDLKVSLYPPVIYHKAKKKTHRLHEERCASSLRPCYLVGTCQYSRQRQSEATGFYRWNTVGCQDCGQWAHLFRLYDVFICYWASVGEGKENFEAVGTTSKIDFRQIYMRFRRALESKPDEAKGIFRFWHERVFKGITGVPPLPSGGPVPGDVDEDEELERAMGGLDFDDHSLLYSDEEADASASHGSVRLGPSAQGPSTATPGPRAGEPVLSTNARPSGHVEPGPADNAPGTGSDSEIDESISSPIRLSRRRANVVYSDDEPSSQPANSENDADLVADGPAEDPEADGGEAEDLRELEAQLKGLTVVKLRAYLKTAQQTIPSKATKKQVVAAVLASDAALDAYRADLE
ncbi:hypothetical protein C8R45DRAFT_1113390 [Mycena sanguinolenta]|nr:hypothetical protein C8R45DRAFT_1113390 [Mycena sanguinolenta]